MKFEKGNIVKIIGGPPIFINSIGVVIDDPMGSSSTQFHMLVMVRLRERFLDHAGHVTMFYHREQLSLIKMGE